MMKEIPENRIEEAAPEPGAVARLFSLPAGVRSCEPYGGGHINRTYHVLCDNGEAFLLQRISDIFAPRMEGLMNNIALVTDHLRRSMADPARVLTLVPTKKGGNYAALPDGGWRMYRFVEGAGELRFENACDALRKCAFAFGAFMSQLEDFDAGLLIEPLPDFHNTPLRFGQLDEALRRDAAGRKEQVRDEIDFLTARREQAGTLHRMRMDGQLPVRVTHNDTKLDNILFDAKTGEALCIIDLDTVMPGLSLYDFGDMVRSGASSAAEDERDLEKVHFCPDRYEALREGFLTGCPSLTQKEREMLPWGGYVITLEQAARFLTDYLMGDVYYHTDRPGHNLDRCRTQIRLVQEMEMYLDVK